jgi:hypothetical protein
MNQTTARRPFLASLLGGAFLPFAAQGQYQAKQSDRPEPIQGDEAGFRPIFNGKNLEGWEGDPKYWRAENNCLTGEVTPENLLKSNTFIIWRGGSPADFELKVDYRLSAGAWGGNSGINYRSSVIPDPVTPSNKFAMRGYQADIDGKNNYTGQNYEEKGRLFLATRGTVTHVTGVTRPVVLSSLGDPKELASFIGTDWNSYHLIIRGNVLAHILNGHLMSMVIDDDAQGRTMKGLIGVQVHVGGPMKIEYRNFRIKEL